MTNAPSEPREFWIMDSGLKYTAEIEKPLEYLSYVAHVIEHSAFAKLQAENAELQAKYNFMVDSAQQNARERDELHEELRQCEMATPTMNAFQVLAKENQILNEELERARLDRENLELVNKDYFEQLERAKAEINHLYTDNHNLQVDHDICFQEAEKFKLSAESYRSALANLLGEISEPSWTDERLSYEERQVSKGAIDEARAALAEGDGNE